MKLFVGRFGPDFITIKSFPLGEVRRYWIYTNLIRLLNVGANM